MHTTRVQLDLPLVVQQLVSKCLAVEAHDGPTGTTLTTAVGDTLVVDLCAPDLAKLRAHLNGTLRQIDVILATRSA